MKTKINKWLFIAVACIVVPVIILWTWIRYPVKCWQETKRSWNLVMRGEHEEDL